MIKKTLTIIALIFLLFNLACTKTAKEDSGNEQIDWLTKIDEAQTLARETGSNIFVHFTGSDWCHWCKKLKSEVYDKDAFINYVSENLVTVKLDFPRNISQSDETKVYNQEQARKYGIRGFPTVLLLDASGNEIARTGYQRGGAEKYVQHIKSLLEKNSN